MSIAFLKSRVELPIAQKNIRADPPVMNSYEGYAERNYGQGLAGRLMRLSHRVCEKPFGPSVKFSRVLEVGAGFGHHLPFVRHAFDRYVMTDRDASNLSSAAPGVEIERQDATHLTYADSGFDRVIAAHILEHVPDPHLALQEWARVLKPGGTLSIVLPCDPGIAWRFGRSLGPRSHATKIGMAYDYWMAREHINSINNLVHLIRHYFPALREEWAPLRIPMLDVNLFYVCHARV